MGFGDFLFMLFSETLTVISWPSFSLVCPLYVSIRVIETHSDSKTLQCLAFWVLFSLVTYLELALAKPFTWLPLWPQAKGLATILLVIPYFGGASYVYKIFIRPCTKNILWFPRKLGFVLSEQQDNVLYASEGKGNFDGSKELEKLIICKEANVEKVQQEWSCALCLVNTTSSKCLAAHLEGKKHKAKADELATKKRNNLALLDNFNEFTSCRLENWSGISNPIAKSVRLCKWRKPKLGWTKLNTDGSIDKENAGFGGLLRDHYGIPLCAFVSKSTEGDAFLVELWAIWRGLVLALGLGIKVIWIESDSLSVVKMIKRDQPYGPKAGSCLYHIWELLKKFDEYKVSHSWRETNKAADFLSKMVLQGNDVVLWPGDFPESLHAIIKDDAQGKIYYRS